MTSSYLARLLILAILPLPIDQAAYGQAVNQTLVELQERYLELQSDFVIVTTDLAANGQQKATINNFCSVRLIEPSLAARRTYCTQKIKELSDKGIDFESKRAALYDSINALRAQINSTVPKPSARQ